MVLAYNLNGSASEVGIPKKFSRESVQKVLLSSLWHVLTIVLLNFLSMSIYVILNMCIIFSHLTMFSVGLSFKLNHCRNCQLNDIWLSNFCTQRILHKIMNHLFLNQQKVMVFYWFQHWIYLFICLIILSITVNYCYFVSFHSMCVPAWNKST